MRNYWLFIIFLLIGINVFYFLYIKNVNKQYRELGQILCPDQEVASLFKDNKKVRAVCRASDGEIILSNIVVEDK